MTNILQLEREFTLHNPSFKDMEREVRARKWKRFEADFSKIFLDGSVRIERKPDNERT